MTGTEIFALRFVDRHPAAAGRALQELPPDAVARFLSTLSPERRRAVVGGMPPRAAAALVGPDRPGLGSDLLEELPLDQAAALIRHLAPDTREALLAGVSHGRRRRLDRAARFHSGTAGSLADVDWPVVQAGQTVEECLRRSQKSGPGFDYVFVVDSRERLMGVVSRRELGRAPSTARVADVMTPGVPRLHAHSPVAEALGHPAWSELDALPVVDAAGVLLGVLRHRTLRRLGRPGVASASPGLGSMVALGTAYCDLLAGAMASYTTVSARPGAGEGVRT